MCGKLSNSLFLLNKQPFSPVDNPVDNLWIKMWISFDLKLSTNYPQGCPQTYPHLHNDSNLGNDVQLAFYGFELRL